MPEDRTMSRRALLAGGGTALLAACTAKGAVVSQGSQSTERPKAGSPELLPSDADMQ
jgi:hypothetical protein